MVQVFVLRHHRDIKAPLHSLPTNMRKYSSPYVNISCITHNTFTLPTPTESKVMVDHKVAFRYFYDH